MPVHAGAVVIAAWEAALSILSYLHTTRELGVVYGGGLQDCCVSEATGVHPIIISDASFGTTIHPFSGGLVQWRNGPLAWVSRKAKFVPQSSCEIEVNAVVTVLKEGLFVKHLLGFLGIQLDGPMPCITDNKAAYDVIKQPGATKRTTHFSRWLHFAREQCLANAIKMYLTGTENMMADIFTKPVDKTTFLRCCAYIMG